MVIACIVIANYFTVSLHRTQLFCAMLSAVPWEGKLPSNCFCHKATRKFRWIPSILVEQPPRKSINPGFEWLTTELCINYEAFLCEKFVCTCSFVLRMGRCKICLYSILWDSEKLVCKIVRCLKCFTVEPLVPKPTCASHYLCRRRCWPAAVVSVGCSAKSMDGLSSTCNRHGQTVCNSPLFPALKSPMVPVDFREGRDRHIATVHWICGGCIGGTRGVTGGTVHLLICAHCMFHVSRL